MGVLAGRDLLELWERAGGLAPQRRALALAEVVGSEFDGNGAGGEGDASLADRPVGERDARLLALHVDLVGPTMDATAICPSCGETIEFALDLATLLKSTAGVEPEGLTALDGVEVEWRVPTSGDLVHLESLDDPGAAESELLSRCVLAVHDPRGRIGHAGDLPDDLRGAVTAAMSDADPLAEVLVGLACAACERSFTAEVDVARFVWVEVDAAAHRLMFEVDALARAYGWTEADVLALSDRRRAAYLDVIGATS